MINTVGVIGSGTMGSGIAQVAATAGKKVYVFDKNLDALLKSQQKLEKILNRLIEKGRIDKPEMDRIQSNITHCQSLKELSECNLVIEAIIEDKKIKKQVFQELEPLLSADCVVASNTSSLSIASLAACLDKPERFIGIHFFNPAPLMKLVEVIPAIQTGEDVHEKILREIESWGKLVVDVKDTPGFIVNKVARPFYGEALRIYEEGIADFETIDAAMVSKGFRMGPFTLMDFIGNDVNYAVTESVFEAFYYDPRYKPAFTQKRLSEAGFLGRKSGRGYYTYPREEQDMEHDEALLNYIGDRIIMMLINEAADTVHQNIASKEDVDLAMTKGVNYPKGLLKWADEIGLAEVVNNIDTLYHVYHEDRYRCSPMLRTMAMRDEQFFE